MKKVLAAVIVLVVVALLGPLAVGRFAEPRLNAVLDRLLTQTPYLTVVDRSWQGGWFTSRQQVVLEALVPMGGEARPRITLHNAVLHGPVLGLSGLGLARVTTTIDLPPEFAAQLREVFGAAPALEVYTRVGFTGGGSTVMRSEGRTVRLPDGSAEITYGTVKLAADFSRSLDDFELEGRMPQFELRGSDGGVLQLGRLTIEAESSRIQGELYDTDFELRLRQLDFTGPGSAFTARKLHYDSRMQTSDGYVSLEAKIGAGKVSNASSQDLGIEIKGVDYDFSLHHLHADTLARMMTATRAVYASLPQDADAQVLETAMEEGFAAPMREGFLRLLQQDPELAFDDVGVRTSVGDAKLTGRLKLVGVSEQDLQFGFLGALAKADAELTFVIAQALAERIPNGAMMVTAGVEGGHLQREGDRLVARIRYRDGTLSINGRPQGIPFPGAPGMGGETPAPEALEWPDDAGQG